MPQLLTTRAVITCPHGGVGTTVPTTQALNIQGGLAAVEGDTGTLSCVNIVPCVGYTLRSMGLNATTILGRRAVLSTDFQQSYTGLPLTIVETHSFLDDSTAAPLPATGGAPSLDPFLLDVTAPTVIATPPTLAFNSVSGQPLTAPVSFSLSAGYPLEWSMTLLNGVALTNVDLTQGAPGAVVVPAGGAWNTPSLNIGLTMSAAFMGGLGVGSHSIFVTGVSQRGISAYAEVTLTVS